MSMPISSAKRLVENLKHMQEKQGADYFPCPRCGNNRMNSNLCHNALSRYASVYVCSECGTDEALRDMTGEVLPLNEWGMPLGFDCKNEESESEE
ncbi:MAG: hypothetical protein RR162_00390 [Oscillospiraceae bacterium]